MTDGLRVEDLAPEQQALWQRVEDLWALARTRDAAAIRATLHPRYAGWDMSQPRPHDREAAVQSVLGDAPAVTAYRLTPLSVQVYDGQVGVVHYAYAAMVAPKAAPPQEVTGRWTEIYVKEGGQWIMAAVSGRPDASVGPQAG